MSNVKKWLAMLLAVSLLFNLIPMNILAAESADEPLVTEEPQGTPTASPAPSPTEEPQSTPTASPAPSPTEEPQGTPTESPTPSPTEEPQVTPTASPAPSPTEEPQVTETPTESPTPSPTEEPQVTETPTESPTPSPTEEPQIPTIGDAFADAFLATLAEKNITADIVKSDEIITLTIGEGDAQILALLSQQTQTASSNYQNWNIKFNLTGTLDLTGTDYQGLGDSGCPFQGKFTGNIGGIKTSRTIFKALSVTADLDDVQITWTGPQDKPILAVTLIADANNRTVNMPLASATSFSPYIGKLTGKAGLVTLPSLNYSAAKAQSTDATTAENLGLVCNTMDDGTQLQISALILPDSETIDLRGSGNVGGLVGYMKQGTMLILAQPLTLELYLSGQNTGGLVGSLNNASVSLPADGVTIDAVLNATKAAGGIAGVVETVTGPLGADANVVLQSVSAKGNQNSGVLYGSCTATGEFDPFIGVSFAEDAKKEVSGQGSCGGVFGTLALEGNGKCTISRTTDISSTLSSAGNTTKYGGIVGTLTGKARKNALVVENCNITSIVDVGNDKVNYPKYLGGIVADQQTNTTVDAKNSTITISNPKTVNGTYGIGGLCTTVGDGALLIADTMKVVINSFIEKQGSSGVAASTGKRAVVFLKNSLDLSECLLATCDYSGQIVGKQDCSLIYGPNVKITRLSTTSAAGTNYQGVELDDIGNYGELYRIDNFLTVDEKTYETTLPELSKTSDGYTLSDETDYACLALAWQSRGYFTTVYGITNSNWSELKSSTITLGDNIDMKDKGIGGLTRDTDKESANDTFIGTLNGNGHKITLDIGANNQANDPKVTKGDGRIYWHNATGLFAVLSSNANVNKLTLDGSIRLSNNKLGLMHSGGLAALMKNARTDKSSALSKVSTNVTFDANANGANQLYLGGLIGLISSASTTIAFNDGASLEANINIDHSGNGSANHFGGAIGAIDNKSSATITCNGATIGGSITSTGTPYNLYAGGLIGTILPSNSYTRNIKITSLTVDGFALTGNASERMGGILGGIWADTDVEINGLSVNTGVDENGQSVPGATLTANGAAELGGLVYRASGKWTVSSVDLSGLTINANSAKALGLMVCHGEPYKDLINGATSDVGGLYLEVMTPWDTGYIVPAVSNFKTNGVFDEFVAYTAYRSSDTDYEITHNGSGIISLKTNNGTVNMTEGEQNTYVNRTDIGKSKQTNPYSRYYYNLPEVKSAIKTAIAAEEARIAEIAAQMAEAEAENGFNVLAETITETATPSYAIDTANELLIWSVYRYAASNLKNYFSFDGVVTSDIGGTATNRANFNMNGLSYYPIDITNESITVQYADVTFYNKEIETLEYGNKSTRGTDRGHSQHYTMHCALFYNFTAENITASFERTLTVNGVTFAGTVGVVNGGSGALLCGNVQGDSRSANTSVCTVILAEADEDSKAVSLNGLSVVPEGDYTPVLINKIGSYAGLTANYVTTTDQQTTKAGSSLIGDVGGESATNVTVAFAGTIKLPETGVFTKATLFNSLRYANGSATYNFNEDKDYTDTNYVHNATHGRELGEGVSVEYASKQGWYFEPETDYVSKIRDFINHNEFSGDLPYVALSPATRDGEHTLEQNWHELAVNVHSYPLIEGCGTYGHPYLVTEDTFREAASFINTGMAVKGWQVRIKSDAAYHTDTGAHDVVVTYENQEKGFTDDDQTHTYSVDYIRTYLQAAYYQITGNIELSNFNGIGADPVWAFKGVITGKQTDSMNSTVTLTGGSSAFIKYSYGCVVRDVDIVLNQKTALTWKDPGRTTDNLTTPQQAPTTFFGGVIGCVLGGDNVIENVTVNTDSAFKLTPGGINDHLIPVGGYVGVIAGGGVLFRGDYSQPDDITTTTSSLYNNPIIGRVLGGYAFYEETGTAPDNGDQNYTINKITSSGSNLIWDGSTLTVNNAQGLLILSAIVSSGAGSKASYAYSNGKARNAAYDQIGASTEPEDYKTATADQNGNTPYLLKQYAGFTTPTNLCTGDTNGITIKFAENAFNMAGYGNGYRGLSARYVSNAAFTSSGVDASTVVLRVKTFDGQNAKVTGINMDVEEYEDDDFHAASLGGIFNIVWTQKQSGGGGDGSNFAQNLTLLDCNVSLKYINKDGAEKTQAKTDTFADEDGLSCVAVGGFIGSVSDVGVAPSARSTQSNYLFEQLHISASEITGPNSAGGLIGASAMTSSALKGFPGTLLSKQQSASFGPSFLNCSYSNIAVTAKLSAGGLIGSAYAYTSGYTPNFGSMGINYNDGNYCFASCTVTEAGFIVGQSSQITAEAKSGVAGGLFGVAGMRVGVNLPDVNTNTALAIANKESMREISLSNVEIKSSTTSDELKRSDGKPNGPDNSFNNAVSGGIIGRISHVNPTYFYDVSLSDCEILSEQASYAYAGGIVGYGYTNAIMVIQRCKIITGEINGKYAGGFVGYGYSASSYQLHLSDCKIEESTVTGSTYAGGLVGRAASKYYLFNILIKNTSIEAKDNNKAGRLFGWMNINDTSDNFWVYAAGISVYVDKDNVSIPSKDGNCDTGKSYIGYISYADYAGMETEVTGEKSPYVTVNPNFTLDGTTKTLTGDAVGKIYGDTYGSVAARIWADQRPDATGKKNLVSYPKVASIVRKAEPTISTFSKEQGCGPELPVLIIKGGNAGVIEDYLNVITNGGYSEAKKSTDAKNNVSLSVTVYAFENGVFREKSKNDLEASKQPASVYLDGNTLKVRGSSYDNTRKRFSLVEASFNVTVNGETRTYTVSVPVVVIRELQYNFMATFYYGAEFHADTFTNLKTHVLESTGNPFTAYLTYEYNREQAEVVDYDWQSYMDDGGNMLAVDKALTFSSGLPAGTQMTLIDCQDGNQAYWYETATSTSTITSVKLSEFTSVSDGSKTFRSSMADVLGVTVTENVDGKYVVETDPIKATLRRNGVYYRPYADGDSAERFDLTVPDLSENAPRENYYLVITVPEQSDPNFYLNGGLSSSLEWEDMPSKGTQVHRYNHSINGVGTNDESTYQISTGYRQNLISLAAIGEPINLAAEDRNMQVNLQDTITFSNQQAYGNGDQLFVKFNVSLQEHTAEPSDVTELQFPAGTTGTVRFFIQDGSRNYYIPDGASWKTTTTETEAASYPWTSRGANMELLLSADGTTALDLAGVRQMIKGSQSTGSSDIIITAMMDVKFSSQEVLNAVVPASANSGADIWAQLHYVAMIATQAFSLDYSSTRAAVDDNAKYYRGVTYQAILSMDADLINQLGINPLELVPEYLTTIDGKKASRIDLTAALNLEDLPDAESVLQKTKTIQFTLSLLRRKGENYIPMDSPQNYLAFEWPDQSTAWTWTITQDGNGSFMTSDLFDGKQFTIPLKAYVFTNQTGFANYKIQLSVSFLDANGQSVSVQVDDKDAYVVYTFACIWPSFYDPSSGS